MAVGRARLQPDRAPDAGRDRARHDVPAPHVRRFADEQPLLAVLPAHAWPRRSETAGRGCTAEPSRTAMRLVAGAQRGGHVEAVLDQHVGRPADLDAVDPDRRQRVQPGEDQVPAWPASAGASVELARVPPFVGLVAGAAGGCCRRRRGRGGCRRAADPARRCPARAPGPCPGRLPAGRRGGRWSVRPPGSRPVASRRPMRCGLHLEPWSLLGQLGMG